MMRDARGKATMLLMSVAALGLQLVLIRALAEAYHYHFTYLVISIALLGFGVAGVLLSLARRSFEHNPQRWIAGLLLGYTVSSALVLRLADRLPIDIQYLLYDPRQVGFLLLYNLLLILPFLCAGGVVAGLLLTRRTQAGVYYGINLLGSGLGGLIAPMLLHLLPGYVLVPAFSLIGLAALLLWLPDGTSGENPLGMRGLIALAAVVVGIAVLFPTERMIDQYKMGYQVRLQQQQGHAHKLAERLSPRGWIEAYSSPHFHFTMFAGLQAESGPPPQTALLLDGQLTGTVFRLTEPTQGSAADAIMEHTPQSLAYRIQQQQTISPRVLILDEAGGVNVWLAQRYDPANITVVHPNPDLLHTVQNDLHSEGGWILDSAEVIASEPRRFLERAAYEGREYDIIHFAGSEGMPAETGGLGGIEENHLMTTEGFAAAWSLLSDNGMLSIVRGLQTPARDTLRIFSTLRHMLDEKNQTAADHVLFARNYLAGATLLSKQPLTANSPAVLAVHDAAEQLILDIDYIPGIQLGDTTRRNRIPGPDGAEYSYYHLAALRLLAGSEGEYHRFIDEWVYDISPSTDNRPYFHQFFRWQGIRGIVEAFGPDWFRRLELGYIVLLFTAFGIILTAALLLPLPTVLAGSRPSHGRLRTWLYFSGTGLGFIGLEMNYISVFTRHLGDPLLSASLVLTTMLISAGAGSLLQQLPSVNRHESGWTPARKAAAAAAALVVLILLYEWAIGAVFTALTLAPDALRFAAAAGMLFPVGMLLGVFFPAGIQALHTHAADHIPLAWAVDGFASVAAAPLAVLAAVSLGTQGVTLIALGCYGVTAIAAQRRFVRTPQMPA